uniref:Protein kinase domain-containing protein n=1 Tax=Arcella intermedia TaxID=1963864 RepID=A0A6B2LMV4_9EUKA
MFRQDGNIKLIDFGTATRVDNCRRSTVGTPWYCAPEVINSEEYGNRCDIWSLGCFSIELVSGKPPFDELNDIACLFKMAEGKPPLPNDVTPLCKSFLSDCLILNWKNRPTSSKLLGHPFLKMEEAQEEVARKQLMEGTQRIALEKAHLDKIKNSASIKIKL